MARNKNTELARLIGMNPLKPDSFQLLNDPLMTNLHLWSCEKIDLMDVIQAFFGIKVKTKIVAILLDIEVNSWIGVAASWQYNNQSGQIRIDAKLTEFLLDKAFGESHVNKPFSIKKINQLELNIIQAFLSNIETKLKELWEIDAKHPYLMDSIYLVWLVESEEKEIGKIAYSMPASFKPKASKSEEIDQIDLTKLANTGIKVPISLTVGSTKLPLTEIKSLEAGDLVIFEESDCSKLKWHLGEIGLVLPEEDHPIFIKEIENPEELAEKMKKSTLNDDPLSSLPLELSAEFQKVQIPLKQVLELKSGGVLPLGSVLESELTLTAQGKPVARGELVIIGNQFGMRITELLIGSKKQGKGIQTELGDIGSQQGLDKGEVPTFQEELKDLEES